MATRMGAVSGYDLGYVWRSKMAKDGEKDKDGEKPKDGQKDTEREYVGGRKGGYYIDAAQAGEPPGRWFGRGAEALGFANGHEVEYKPYMAVYQQEHPETGEKLGRGMPAYKDYLVHLKRLEAAEPHATAERHMAMEREAAQATRKSAPYTDFTLSLVKSVSIFHTSIKENERQARLAGDDKAAAWWAARDAEMNESLQAANRAGLEHLQQYAQTRTGHHGTRVACAEPGRYEPVGLVVTSWLQGTSRDGDPQDHIHNQVARMGRTDADGKWRAVDSYSTRPQINAMRAITSEYLRADMTRKFGVEWIPRKDGEGFEIKGISRAQIERYSTRSVHIDEKTRELTAQWAEEHGRQPSRRQELYLKKLAEDLTKPGKEKGPIDHDKILHDAEAKWEVEDGIRLRDVAGKVSGLRGPDAERAQPGPGPAPSTEAQMRAMKEGLARVQDKQSTWLRADLMREISNSMSAEATRMDPEASVALLHDLADRAIAGEAGQVMPLDAPDFLDTPEYLMREVDGRRISVYSRPGTERFATSVQLAREKELLDTADKQTELHLTREESARLLGAEADELEAAALERASEPTRQLHSGLTLAQAAAAHRSMTTGKTGYAIVGPPGTGKTTVAIAEARMWRDAGKGPVVFITPSQNAANVIRQDSNGEFQVYNFAQFLGHTEQERGAIGPVKIEPGTLALLDETNMKSLPDLRDIAKHVADSGGILRMHGDGSQLVAPEGGGGLSLITRTQEHVQLAEPMRFKNEWERDATLRLRAGDKAILEEYDQHGRIRGGGTLDEVMDQARSWYLAEYLQGHDALLIAQSREHNRELSQRVREDLQHLGLVQRDTEASLRAGAKASVGDLIVTRKNDAQLGIANGDSWRVEALDGETITMRKMLDPDRETGERRFADETVRYTAAKEGADLGYAYDPEAEAEEQDELSAGRPADLAYSITGHTAEGRSVQKSMTLATGSEDRNWLTVAATRGREANYFAVVGQPNRADPTPGTRTAPELQRYDRIQQERAGLPEQERKLSPEAEELRREPIAVLSDILERDGTELSALETWQRNLANADHLAKLHAIWEGETRPEIHARYERELREQLPDGFKDAKLDGYSTWLFRSLRDAEAAGLNSKDVLARAINSQPLDGARDVGAVVDARVRAQVGQVVPQPPKPWSERVPDSDNPDRHAYLTQVAAAMDDRAHRLGEHAAEASPAWAERHLGPVPDDPEERQAWQERASAVASYRELSGYDDPTEPIGPEPVNSPETRPHWHAAFAALGPADGPDLRGLSDGQLLMRRSSYEAETAWAPRWVSNELRAARQCADDAELDAVLSAARAEAARKQEEHNQAQLHEGKAWLSRTMAERHRSNEAEFAKTMEARKDWEETTRQARHDALAAHTEYVRRHPDTDLPPLKSAEPSAHTEEEQAQLHAPAETDESRALIAAMTERTRAANEEIASRRSLEVPHEEDHEWQGYQAWGQSSPMYRDAVLQPPPPEIKPAAEVADRAAEIDYEAGD